MLGRIFNENWRECPRCHYPMSRWGRLKHVPERNWRGEPEKVLEPFILSPGWLLDLFLYLLVRGTSTVSAVTGGTSRRFRKARAGRLLQDADWMCAQCFHTERSL